jgi:hypothetical protein
LQGDEMLGDALGHGFLDLQHRDLDGVGESQGVGAAMAFDDGAL